MPKLSRESFQAQLPCKIGRLLAAMDEESRAVLVEALAEKGISGPKVIDELRSAGYADELIPKLWVLRAHRRGECACPH